MIVSALWSNPLDDGQCDKPGKCTDPFWPRRFIVAFDGYVMQNDVEQCSCDEALNNVENGKTCAGKSEVSEQKADERRDIRIPTAIMTRFPIV